MVISCKTLSFITLLCVVGLQAQNKRLTGNYFLLFGGAYNTQVKTNKSFAPVSYSYHNTFSPYIGIGRSDTLMKMLTLKTSVYFVERGFKTDYRFEQPSFYRLRAKNLFQMFYLSVPISLNFYYKKFYIGGGIETSFLLKAHYKFDYQEDFFNPATNAYVTSGTLIDRWDDKKPFQTVDVGFCFIAGYNISKRFDVTINVFHGLLKVPFYDYFTIQNFEYKYSFQETFMLGLNYRLIK